MTFQNNKPSKHNQIVSTWRSLIGRLLRYYFNMGFEIQSSLAPISKQSKSIKNFLRKLFLD